MLGGGIQLTFEGGVSAKILVTRFVWFCLKGFLLLKNESRNFF